ncbi:uncharacterized protein LOC126900031 isoform X11 [Daktulosphaira vitifoliae]|uniref:uncharacterized protein LOC126900031 isoform X11 n=1 Tax=Daktulosphaira vitifoliae TaxID=58002 RepID=UPI0021AA8356|nr:uncharacterized protein LOC126900031 isoform X11 [Daktulosphaira vitifoliae]
MIKMNLKFYFSVLNLWSLKYVLTTYCTSYDFELYLFEVVKHILYHHQLQETLNLWHNKNITDDSIKLLNISLDNIDINAQIFNSIVISMNCRYAKLLQIYDSYIKAMIGECENYYNKKLFDKFIECTKLVQDVVCNSSGMFENFYDILTFIINLDVKFIFDEYVTPITIINEIHTIYTYNSSKKKPCMFTYIKSNGHFDTDEACKDLLNIKHFHATVTDMLHNLQFLDTASNLTSNSIHKYLLEKYNDKYALQKEKDKSYVQFIYDDLIMCYNEAIKYDNDNLGYQELFHPTVPGLVPPFDDIIDCDKITTLNKLFAKCYLKPFMNIKIVVEKREIDAAEVFQIANSENIKEKIKYFGQLLRCRYVEILKNHHIILTAIMNACKDRTLSGIVNHFAYCMNQLRNSVSYSINMFKSLLFTMSKLKKLCFWEYNTKAPNCLKKLASIITEYVYDIKALNIVLSESKTMNEVEAQTYLDELYKYFLKLQKGFRNETSHHLKNRCEFLKEFTHPLTFKSSFNLKISTSIHDLSVYEDICLEMNSFCDEIIENDYKKLGFNDLI